jgi:GNAT superfamily N-acetyltransferase
MNSNFGSHTGSTTGPAPAARATAFVRESGGHIEFLPPLVTDDKILFQVFCNGLPIAFARLRRQQADAGYEHPVLQLFSAVRFPTWSLHSIQVSQNYRNRGIGTALLQKIQHYCRDHNIQRLVGDMKGELPALERWYLRNGFQVSAEHRLELLIR